MKRVFMSIFFLVLSMALSMSVAGSIATGPQSDSATDVYMGTNVTKSVTISNTDPGTVYVTLPTVVQFSGPVAISIPVAYNATSPVAVLQGSPISVEYKLSVPSDLKGGTYTGTISFADASNSSIYANLAFTLGVIGRLYIDDLDVIIENVLEDETDKDRDISDGDKIRAEAKPGSIVVFNFRIGNAFSDADDIEIKDVIIEITIEDIDDGDDMDEESDDFDIDADDKSDRVKIEFEVPLEVEEKDYTVRIFIAGEDEEDVDHEIYWEIELEVEKESHFVYIKDADLFPQTVECDRTASLDVELLNLGAHDEDEAILEIKNLALGIDIKEKDIEVEEDPDGDNTFEKVYDLEIDDNAGAGVYPIVIKTYYKENKLSDTEVVELTVEECTNPQQTTPPQTTTAPPPITTTPPPITTQPGQPTIINPPIITQADQSSSESSFTSSTAYMVILIIVNVIGIGVIITLIIKTLAKKQV